MNDYQKSIAVSKPPGDVYNAITQHVGEWWSNDLTGAAANVGDRFNIAFNQTKKTFEIIDALPNERVVWQCVKAHIDHASLNNKSEWVGTKLYWTLTPAADGTTVNFLHEGLNQSFECYGLCENGWNYFLQSLEAYINTGKGMPHIKKEAA